ncbi:hypothetical protein ACH4FX_30820 [Streptomyces sp. NPDC018019]|uniref:hypothetical protein n=1 Tax=Streptomyces sp. NPDC018019 TaxID=3365030 RepID=UPI0037BB6F09
MIGYVAYVDLLHTNYAPQGLLPFTGDDGKEQHMGLDVSVQDLRARQRASLDLDVQATADLKQG